MNPLKIFTVVQITGDYKGKNKEFVFESYYVNYEKIFTETVNELQIDKEDQGKLVFYYKNLDQKNESDVYVKTDDDIQFAVDFYSQIGVNLILHFEILCLNFLL